MNGRVQMLEQWRVVKSHQKARQRAATVVYGVCEKWFGTDEVQRVFFWRGQDVSGE